MHSKHHQGNSARRKGPLLWLSLVCVRCSWVRFWLLFFFLILSASLRGEEGCHLRLHCIHLFQIPRNQPRDSQCRTIRTQPFSSSQPLHENPASPPHFCLPPFFPLSAPVSPFLLWDTISCFSKSRGWAAANPWVQEKAGIEDWCVLTVDLLELPQFWIETQSKRLRGKPTLTLMCYKMCWGSGVRDRRRLGKMVRGATSVEDCPLDSV